MSATDFEAEARAWLQARDSDYRVSDVTSLAAKFREIAEREGQDGYTRGQSDGYRRGVEAARAYAESVGWPDAAHAIRVALLDSAPAAASSGTAAAS